MPARPHISPALQQLRTWVTVAGVVVILGAVCQLGVYSVVRTTDVRWERLEGAPNAAVVDDSRPRVKGSEVALVEGGGGVVHAAASKPARGTAEAPADVNRVRSMTDANLEVASAFVSVSGLIAAGAMAVLSLAGVVVAGGGNVPGIAHTVRAGAWSLVVLGMGVPWSAMMGPSMVPGVFCPYAVLARAAETRTGAAALVSFVMSPMVVMGLAGCCVWWFRRGVEAGIVLTSLSEVDEALEREMLTIRERGVGRLNPGGRAATGLHQVMEPERVAVEEGPRLRRAAGAERMSDDEIAPSMLRRRSDPGAARPI